MRLKRKRQPAPAAPVSDQLADLRRRYLQLIADRAECYAQVNAGDDDARQRVQRLDAAIVALADEIKVAESSS